MTLESFRYFPNVANFLKGTIFADRLENLDSDYLPGTQRFRFYQRRERPRLEIFDHKAMGLDYEEALLERVQLDFPVNFHVVVGGLGSGKSTAVRKLRASIIERRKQLQDQNPCSCEPCDREPINIDLMAQLASTPARNAVQEIARAIRFKIYGALLNTWIKDSPESQKAIEDNPRAMKVIRRLLLANDIAAWADNERPGSYPLDLEHPDCLLDDPLLQQRPTATLIDELVTRFRKGTTSFASRLNAITSDPETSYSLASTVVGFYISQCSAENPCNLIVVDNIDELPTEHIEQVAARVQRLAALTSKCRFIMPVRPSSLGLEGFVNNPNYMFHYGPNCFEMMLQRISEKLLLVPREELIPLFTKRPSKEEIDVLLVTAYLYSLMLAAGNFDSLGQPVTLAECRPQVHPNHDFLTSISVGGKPLGHLGRTIGAIVGTSGRYATATASRFFYHIYQDGQVLDYLFSRGLRIRKEVALQIGYSHSISAILGDPGEGPTESRLVNLFRPSSFSTHPGWPTLARVRILLLLQRRLRVRVGEVLASLALYGVPVEVGLQSLNALHNKDRLLVWFSRNKDLRNRKQHLSQDVVISEHGLAYLESVVVDFEYLWFCASQLGARFVGEGPANFRARVGEFVSILSMIAKTDSKQLLFSRLSGQGLWKDSAESEQFLGLWLAYAALPRALSGASVAADRSGNKKYEQEVTDSAAELLTVCLELQEIYRIFFGSNGYLVTYEEPVARARVALTRALTEGKLGGDDFEEIGRSLLSSWKEQASIERFPESQVQVSDSPKEDLIESLSRFGAAFPGLSKSIKALSEREVAQQEYGRFLIQRERLKTLISSRVPTTSMLAAQLRRTTIQAELAKSHLSRNAATGAKLTRWTAEQVEGLDSFHEDLVAYNFKIEGFPKKREMDEFKGRVAKISDLVMELGQFLGVQTPEVLALRWL
ncbi:MAG: hypothetical protein AAF604_06290 [Acidobacteriota bacterium]